MKTILYKITACLCLLFISCDKMPENGDLDGLWQLMEISDNGNVRNTKADRLYCSFQLKLFMLGDPTEPRHYFGYFANNGNTIRFHNFTYRSNYSQDNQSEDKLMNDDEDLQTIAPWGFYSTDCTYSIELSSKILILRHDNLTITYRKI